MLCAIKSLSAPITAVWGTQFTMQSLTPYESACMVVAYAFNQDGAKHLGRMATKRGINPLCYTESAEFLQDNVIRSRFYYVAIAGSPTYGAHCFILDKAGNVIFDPDEQYRTGYIPNKEYRYALPVERKPSPRVVNLRFPLVESVNVNEAIRYLDNLGLWEKRMQ